MSAALPNTAPHPIPVPLLALVQAKNTLRRVVEEHEAAALTDTYAASWHQMLASDARRDMASLESAMAEQGYAS